jgi:hypothetical protein
MNDPCTLTIINFLCSPLTHSFSSPAHWTKCSILPTEMYLKSPGFIKWWSRCLNLTTSVSQSQRTRGVISDACLHLSHSGLFISPKLNSSKPLPYSFTLAPNGHPPCWCCYILLGIQNITEWQPQNLLIGWYRIKQILHRSCDIYLLTFEQQGWYLNCSAQYTKNVLV